MWLISLLLLASSALAAEQSRVVVLDTGLDLSDPRFDAALCKTGHMDLTGRGLDDTNGHGTHIVGLIQQYAKDANYCLIIVKYYTDRSNMDTYLSALDYAVSIKPKYVVIAAGGPGFNEREYGDIANSKATFVVAAGNNNQNLDIEKYYPASYAWSNEVVVMATEGKYDQRASYSNYSGPVNASEVGEAISTLPNGLTGKMRGTSQATAIHMGKILNLEGTRQ